MAAGTSMDRFIGTSSKTWTRMLDWTDQLCPESISSDPNLAARARLFVVTIVTSILALTLVSIRDYVFDEYTRIAWSGIAVTLLVNSLFKFKNTTVHE